MMLKKSCSNPSTPHSILFAGGEAGGIPFQAEDPQGSEAMADIHHADTGEVVVESGKKSTPRLAQAA